MGSRIAVALLLLVAPLLRADVTIRNTIEIKFGSAFPPAVADALKQQVGSIVPSEIFVRVKGDKSVSSFGALMGITDFTKGEITLLDPKSKQFATVPMADYPDKILPQAPESAAASQVLQSMKFDVQTKKTGQSGMVQGIRAEEYLTVITMELPGLPGGGGGFHLEMHNWIVPADEIDRVPAMAPALRELAAYSARATSTFNPGAMIQRMMARFPGFGEQMRGAMDELMKTSGSLSVKTTGGIYLPVLTALSQPAPAGADPSIPMIEFEMDLAEVSSSPISEDFFQVPAGYKEAPIADLMKAVAPAPAQGIAPGTTPAK